MKYENTFKATDQILCLYLRFSLYISAGLPLRGDPSKMFIKSSLKRGELEGDDALPTKASSWPCWWIGIVLLLIWLKRRKTAPPRPLLI